MLEKIKELDSFGYEMTFTWKGLHTYRTLFGTIMTLTVNLAILGYGVSELVGVLRREGYTMTRYDSKGNMFSQDFQLQLSQDHFDIKADVFYQGFNQTIREDNWYRCLGVNFQEVYIESKTDKVSAREEAEVGSKDDDYSGYLYESANIPSVMCNNTRFSKIEEEFQSVCPEFINTTLFGNVGSSKKRIFQAYFSYYRQDFLDRFYPGESCVSSNEYLEAINFFEVFVSYKVTYFDLNEFEGDPIKEEYQTDIMRASKVQTIYKMKSLSNNTAILEDSIFSSSFHRKNQMYVASRHADIFFSDISLLNLHSVILFQLDNVSETITRRVSNFVDVLQKLGGFYGAIKAISFILMSLIQKRIYFADIVSQTILQEAKYSNFSSTTQNCQENKLVCSNQPMKMRFQDIFCRLCQSKKKSFATSKALRKIYKELDVLEYLQNMRKLKFMYDIFLANDEKKLEQYSQWHLNKDPWEFQKPFEKDNYEEAIKAIPNIEGRKKKRKFRIIQQVVKGGVDIGQNEIEDQSKLNSTDRKLLSSRDNNQIEQKFQSRQSLFKKLNDQRASKFIEEFSKKTVGKKPKRKANK